jgi:mitochondrial fission protein ELM1
MISAGISRGGRTVVLMQPSLPNAWFDLCFIPEHDAPRFAENVVLTKGALNTMRQSNSLESAQGTILIGGPSRHHQWDEQQLLDQINQLVVSMDIQWTISDSPRTPESTRQLLERLNQNNVHYQSFHDAQHGWLENQLTVSGTTWVTEDSVSMIYEALTCGSAVGLLSVPVRHTDRVIQAVRHLAAAGEVLFFNDWKNGKVLARTAPPLSEADRCAQLLLEKFNLI